MEDLRDLWTDGYLKYFFHPFNCSMKDEEICIIFEYLIGKMVKGARFNLKGQGGEKYCLICQTQSF